MKTDRWGLRTGGWVCCIALLFVSACETYNLVQLDAAPAPFTPVFLLMDISGHGIASEVYGLSVLRCGADTSMWTIAATGQFGVPQRVVYGEPPKGFITTTGPAALEPGCYDVFVSNARKLKFRIAPNGSVTGEGKSENAKVSVGTGTAGRARG